MVSLDGLRVYLDSNTLIYAFEGAAEYVNLRDGLLRALEEGRATAVTSNLTLLEVVAGPRRANDPELEAAYRQFMKPSSSLHVEPISIAVIERAIDLRSSLGFKTPDAIHIATGMLTGCSHLISRDLQWSRAGIEVIQPQNIV